MNRKHRMPFGAEVSEDAKVRFRLWAPQAERVDVMLYDDKNLSQISLLKKDEGWFELVTRDAQVGTHYHFQIDSQLKVPDPASRFQPLDVKGPSEVVEPAEFDWQDESWHGRRWEEAIIYELHVGTFTPEGTFAGVIQHLDYLIELGITAIELMPVSDFPGARNWGYDGVLPYAPDSCYGRPEDLKRLIQVAHQKGLMMFLDVVYNHFGPEGNYLRAYSPEFFTDRHHTPWGDAINFDGPNSRVVRDYFIHNALYWLEEYHFDGLRLDAVHAIEDDSEPDILTELAEMVRNFFEPKRLVHLVLENYNNNARYLRRDAQNDTQLYDAQWNDDIHHALHVLITGERDGYYSDYSREPVQQLGRCLTEGFAYQGNVSEYHGVSRGEISRHLPPVAFVSFLQNHDQVGNRALGERIVELADKEALKAAMAILLLAPSPPLLFMGEEFGASTPFLFFCDFDGELATKVTEGRRSEFSRFAQFNSPGARDQIPDPNCRQTFLRSKLEWSNSDAKPNQEWLQFYRQMLTLRQEVIFPLLRRDYHAQQVQFKTYRDRALSVEWRFGNAILTLVANLNSASSGLMPCPSGRAIYSNTAIAAKAACDTEQTILSPWAVAWFMNS